MPDYRITWEIDWSGDTPRQALDAMMLKLFGGEWPSGSDHFVITDEMGAETAINYLGEDDEDQEEDICDECGAARAEHDEGRIGFGCTRTAPATGFECQDCGAIWGEEELLPIKVVLECVLPGEPIPAGECPNCWAPCHERKERE